MPTTEITYFGEPWPSGICDEGKRVATPVGAPCLICDEAIRPDDRGVYIPPDAPRHRECDLRVALGGANHHRRLCGCFGGSEPPDPPGLTLREAGVAAWDAFVERV